ncbi:hypothetical protein AAG570_002349 [Ranatra chinensis]|uniref:Uncharacterized protein n=1 Tax=Ranatra chinensis TaxID=642074 RepID=A0ABD0YTZ7_9HEMI
MPVPLFLVAQNAATLCHLLISAKQLPAYEFIVTGIGLASSVLVLLYSGSVIYYIDRVWLTAYTIVLILSELFHDSMEHQHKDVTNLYYKNAFSFIVLAPFSLYLGEAFTALNFKYLWQMGFYAGCISSGVLGTLLQVYSLHLQRRGCLDLIGALVKVPVIALSTVVFHQDTLPPPLWLLVAVNSITTILLTQLTKPSVSKVGEERKNGSPDVPEDEVELI